MGKPKTTPILIQRRTSKGLITVYGCLFKEKLKSDPYFFIVANITYPNRSLSLSRDGIKSEFGDRFDDLIALHLSDINGVPMYALDNAKYWAGENQSLVPNPERLAEHLRISLGEANRLITEKVNLAVYIELQKPRWKAEAKSCIAYHNLQIVEE